MIESQPLPRSLESLEGHKRFRVTVNNIVQTVQVEGETEPVYFAMLDPRMLNEKGERRWQSLGGAIRLTDAGRELIELIGGEMRGASESKDSDDARFSVPTKHFEQIMELFSQLRPIVFEDTADREVIEELSGKEFDAFDPILTEDEARQVKCTTHSVFNEIPKYEGVSGRFAKDMPYGRVTYISSISMPKDVFAKLAASPLIHVFSKDEVEHITEVRMRGEVPKMSGGDALATTTLLLSKKPVPVQSEDSSYLYAEDAELEYVIFMALGNAIKEGRADLDQVLKNLTYEDGRPVQISAEHISDILAKDVPDIRTLVMDTV